MGGYWAFKVLFLLLFLWVLLHVLVIWQSNHRPSAESIIYPIRDPILVMPAAVSHDVSQDSERHLVYDCTSASCGGWADRLEGITTAYLIAMATGRRFHIIMTQPVNIEKYLEPNEVNWKVHYPLFRNKSVRFYNYVDRQDFHRSLRNIDFDFKHPEDVVRIRMNAISSQYLTRNALYRKRLRTFLNQSLSSTFSTIHRRLFKFSDELKARLSAFRTASKPGRKHGLVCAQIRTYFKEKSMPFRLNATDVDIFWNFLSTAIRGGALRIFVATDNETVSSQTSLRFGSRAVTVKGHIDHSDRSDRKDVFNGFWKTLVDFYALEMCDTLVLSMGSSFARLPAFLRGRDDNLYIFKRHRIQKTTLKDVTRDYQLEFKFDEPY